MVPDLEGPRPCGALPLPCGRPIELAAAVNEGSKCAGGEGGTTSPNRTTSSSIGLPHNALVFFFNGLATFLLFVLRNGDEMLGSEEGGSRCPWGCGTCGWERGTLSLPLLRRDGSDSTDRAGAGGSAGAERLNRGRCGTGIVVHGRKNVVDWLILPQVPWSKEKQSTTPGLRGRPFAVVRPCKKLVKERKGVVRKRKREGEVVRREGGRGIDRKGKERKVGERFVRRPNA